MPCISRDVPDVSCLQSGLILYNDCGELLNFCLTKGNVDDRNLDVYNMPIRNLLGDLFADKEYISKKLFDVLWNGGIHLVTGIKSNTIINKRDTDQPLP